MIPLRSTGTILLEGRTAHAKWCTTFAFEKCFDVISVKQTNERVSPSELFHYDVSIFLGDIASHVVWLVRIIAT